MAFTSPSVHRVTSIKAESTGLCFASGHAFSNMTLKFSQDQYGVKREAEMEVYFADPNMAEFLAAEINAAMAKWNAAHAAEISEDEAEAA